MFVGGGGSRHLWSRCEIQEHCVFFFYGTNDSCSLDNRLLTFGILLGGCVSLRGNEVWSEAGGFCIEKKKRFLNLYLFVTQLFPYRKGGTLQPSKTESPRACCGGVIC